VDSGLRLFAAIVGVASLVAAAVLLLLGGVEEKEEPAIAAIEPVSDPIDSEPPDADRPEPAPAAPPERRERPQLEIDNPKGTYPVIWVRAGRRVEIRTEPRGGKHVGFADRRTEFDSPTVFGVLRTDGRWAGISTAALPNGQLGWVRLDPRRLRSGWTRFSIVVDLSERAAALRRGDRVERSFAVTVGMPGADTPTGRFAVTDTFRGDLNPAYGCCALAISATQPNLPSGWLGGRRIAIHGTSGPLGVAASNGCVRAADRDVSALVDRVPLGTPVFIRG
jgi:L,D-transpeptidase catalytic domain